MIAWVALGLALFCLLLLAALAAGVVYGARKAGPVLRMFQPPKP